MLRLKQAIYICALLLMGYIAGGCIIYLGKLINIPMTLLGALCAFVGLIIGIFGKYWVLDLE